MTTDIDDFIEQMSSLLNDINENKNKVIASMSPHKQSLTSYIDDFIENTKRIHQEDIIAGSTIYDDIKNIINYSNANDNINISDKVKDISKSRLFMHLKSQSPKFIEIIFKTMISNNHTIICSHLSCDQSRLTQFKILEIYLNYFGYINYANCLNVSSNSMIYCIIDENNCEKFQEYLDMIIEPIPKVFLVNINHHANLNTVIYCNKLRNIDIHIMDAEPEFGEKIKLDIKNKDSSIKDKDSSISDNKQCINIYLYNIIN